MPQAVPMPPPDCDVCGEPIPVARWQRFFSRGVRTCSAACRAERVNDQSADCIRRRNARQKERNARSGHKRPGRPPKGQEQMKAYQHQKDAVEDARQQLGPIDARRR